MYLVEASNKIVRSHDEEHVSREFLQKGVKTVGGQDCFILRLESDPFFFRDSLTDPGDMTQQKIIPESYKPG